MDATVILIGGNVSAPALTAPRPRAVQGHGRAKGAGPALRAPDPALARQATSSAALLVLALLRGTGIDAVLKGAIARGATPSVAGQARAGPRPVTGQADARAGGAPPVPTPPPAVPKLAQPVPGPLAPVLALTRAAKRRLEVEAAQAQTQGAPTTTRPVRPVAPRPMVGSVGAATTAEEVGPTEAATSPAETGAATTTHGSIRTAATRKTAPAQTGRQEGKATLPKAQAGLVVQGAPSIGHPGAAAPGASSSCAAPMGRRTVVAGALQVRRAGDPVVRRVVPPPQEAAATTSLAVPPRRKADAVGAA